MSYLDRKDLISADLRNRIISTKGTIKYYNTDKNIAYIYMKLVTENEDGVEKPIQKDEASNYSVTITVKKPGNSTKEVIGVLSDDLVDENCAIYKFALPSEFTDQVGDSTCETVVKNDTKELVMNTFVYSVKADMLTGLNGEIVTDPDLPILKELIQEVKETAQTVNNIDDVNITDTKTFSNKKIEEKFSGVDAQFNTMEQDFNSQMVDMTNNLTAGKIITFGDSNTQGVDSNGLNYTDWLKWLFNANNIVNMGIAGNWTNDLVSRLDTVYAQKPTHCIVMIGTNDITHLVDTQNWETMKLNIATIINGLKGHGIIPIICAVIPRNEGVVSDNTITWNRWLQGFCRSNNIIFVDTYSPLIGSNGLILPECYIDGTNTLHINGYGAYLVANAIKSKLPSLVRPDYGYWYGEKQGCPNNIFQIDSNADGLPDNWSSSVASGVTGATSIVNHPNIGKYLQIVKNASSLATDYYGAYAEISGSDYVEAEQPFDVSLDVDVANFSGVVGARILCQTFDNSYVSKGTFFITPKVITYPLSNFRINNSFITPVGATKIRLILQLYGAGAGTVCYGNIVARKRVV